MCNAREHWSIEPPMHCVGLRNFVRIVNNPRRMRSFTTKHRIITFTTPTSSPVLKFFEDHGILIIILCVLLDYLGEPNRHNSPQHISIYVSIHYYGGLDIFTSVYRLREMRMARERNSTFDQRSRVCGPTKLTWIAAAAAAAAAVAEHENEREKIRCARARRSTSIALNIFEF